MSNIIESIIKKGKDKGFESIEVGIIKNKSFDSAVFEGAVDKYSISDDSGLSVRGIYNGKMGYSYSETINDEIVDYLIDEAIDNAKAIDSDDLQIIYSGDEDYKEVKSYNPAFEKVSVEKKLDFLKKLESSAKAYDERITAVNYNVYGDSVSVSKIMNSEGLNLEEKSNVAYAYVSVVAKENDDVKTANRFVVSKSFEDFQAEKMAKEASQEAISMLGAKSCKSGKYVTVFRNKSFADLLQAFCPVFSAERVQKGLSLLVDRLDEKIAVDTFNLIDNPLLDNGIASRSFDSEGVATYEKKVIDSGRLTTYFHNLKTAHKAGIESTGNAYKGSHKASMGISPSNFYVQKSDVSFDDLIKDIENGILITGLQGLHAGLDPISGDFSLSAHGYKIINGAVDRPVNQITVAGNFLELIQNIKGIGNDLMFAMPSGGSCVGSPSIKVKSLSISGE